MRLPAIPVSPQNRPRFTLVLGRRPRRHDPWVIGAALVPLASMLVIVGCVVRARLVLGRWPAPGDPGGLGFGLPHLLVVAAFQAALVSPLWTAGVALIRWVLHGDRYRVLAACAAAAGLWALVLAWIAVDPGAVVAWARAGGT